MINNEEVIHKANIEKDKTIIYNESNNILIHRFDFYNIIIYHIYILYLIN